MPLFRSRTQGELLAHLFVTDEDGASIAELARRLGVEPSTIQREVERLELAGLVATRRVGSVRVVRPNTSAPIYPELVALLRKAFGPKPLLERALAAVEGVRAAYIFGSWARRYHGETGSLPRDVDVLVVGDPDPDAVYEATRDVERRLQLEVNPIVVAEEEWEHHPLGLVSRVRAGPVVELELERDSR